MSTKLCTIFPDFIFEIIRAHRPQSGMKPMTVIQHLNLVDDICPGFFSSQIALFVSAFSLQRMKETLNNWVIPTVAFSAHAPCHSRLFELILRFMACILTTTIRMMEKSFTRFRSKISHHQSVFSQGDFHLFVDRPSNGLARIQVDDNGQVQPALVHQYEMSAHQAVFGWSTLNLQFNKFWASGRLWSVVRLNFCWSVSLTPAFLMRFRPLYRPTL